MTDHIRTIESYLMRMIEDADRRHTGRRSILDYGANVRRSTAEEVLGFVQSLRSSKAARRTPMFAPAERALARAARRQIGEHSAH